MGGDKVFADTNFWIALISKKDQLHLIAKQRLQECKGSKIFTSEMVFDEFLSSCATYSTGLRKSAADMVDKIRGSEQIITVEQDTKLFIKAFEKYKKHDDKDWGLTDCSSFVIMEENGIEKALVQDGHFAQAGFVTLLKT
jgi:predicted nucleic acid-binding protein